MLIMKEYGIIVQRILHVLPLRVALFLNCCGGRVFAGGSITSARRRGNFDG